jgi:hypothetical protein
MTTIHRLTAEAVAPFFLSLKQTDFRGDLVVFVSNVDKESAAQMRAWGACIKPFNFRGKHVANPLAHLWPLWKLAFASSFPEVTKHLLAHRIFPLFYRRHLLYLDFLANSPNRYTRILSTDCKDVFFQSDPFGWSQSPGLHVFLEEESGKVGQCPHHIRWLSSQFGPDALQSLQDETISCAGTVFGDYSSFEAYLRRMVSLTMQARSLREADGDQGIHNFLIRKSPLSSTTIHLNRRGPVMTIGLMKFSDLRLGPGSLIINEANEIPPVLHQYDRIPELRTILLARISEAMETNADFAR